jgi:hypothetical protein
MLVKIDNPRSDWFGIVGTCDDLDGKRDLTLVWVTIQNRRCMFYRRSLRALHSISPSQ